MDTTRSVLSLARAEAWVHSVLERAAAHQRVEDSRVELKRTWIEPAKAARRLAGHANAARGAEVLWLIGVDEDAGLLGVDPTELTVWWSKVHAIFDGVAPSMFDLILHHQGKAFVALIFETVRAPFVVRNVA